MMLTLGQAHALLPNSSVHGAAETGFTRVHTDTRSVQVGDLFAALRGERFDAHSFLQQAQAAGAAAALVDHVPAGCTLPCLVVPDTLAALQQLAAAWRQRYSGPLIAVVGSNGKTTVTQMIASVLHHWLADGEPGPDSPALATAGNYNNHFGVPLTLLRLRQHHRAAVLELGMNHAGEIALLAALAQPTIALVNNAQREHQEFMASVEAVALENGSVITALGADGMAVLPAADVYLPMWMKLAGPRRVLSFGLTAAADITAHTVWHSKAQHWALTVHTPIGSFNTTLALVGEHNVLNALAATACAIAAGAPLTAIAAGLAAFQAMTGRSQTLRLARGAQTMTLIDDSYNANPDSVRAAIDVLASLPGPRWLLLGDMGEVGTQGPQFHAEVGLHARSSGIDTVWAVGPLAAHAGAHRQFSSVAQLIAALSEGPQAASLLVKGSRFMQMERVVQALQADQATGAAHAA